MLLYESKMHFMKVLKGLAVAGGSETFRSVFPWYEKLRSQNNPKFRLTIKNEPCFKAVVDPVLSQAVVKNPKKTVGRHWHYKNTFNYFKNSYKQAVM